MTAGWVFAYLAVIGGLGAIRLGVAIHDTRAHHRTRNRDGRLDAVITQALDDEAEYLCHDACSFPPCDDLEDGWLCFRHQPPKGKHHPPPLTYSPVPPTVHDISSLGEWR